MDNGSTIHVGFEVHKESIWSGAHVRHLQDRVTLATPVQQRVFQDYLDTVERHHECLQRLESDLWESARSWHWYPVVEALQALRGFQFTAAVTVIAELGDLSRFAHPRQLMSYLGLTPSEYSTGASCAVTSGLSPGACRSRRNAKAVTWTRDDQSKHQPGLLQ